MLIVQKFGGATLSDPAKIRSVAQRIASQVKSGDQIVAVVSAMGSTTNELISLAKKVSATQSLREMDMLLSVGERISMSLLSMALQDNGVRATSLTGSQAGILTDESHSNAFILDIRGTRVQDALKKSDVVVLAGFQGVSPESKEITTLGRGGTDTTAIAMSAFLKADHCEILKDVSGVYSADPRIISDAKTIHELNYDELGEMTFWGAKVLHYRSVELAKHENVLIYVGPAHDTTVGTWIRPKGSTMYEKPRILSLNSFESVFCLRSAQLNLHEAFDQIEKSWEKAQIIQPQILSIEQTTAGVELWISAPREVLEAIQAWGQQQSEWHVDSESWSSVTATCNGTTSWLLAKSILQQLKNKNIYAEQCRWTAYGLSLFLKRKDRESALKELHALIN